MQQGLAACQGTGAEVSRPYYLACLAEVYVMSGQAHGAQVVLNKALKIAQTQGQRLDQARLYWLRGTLLARESPAQTSPAKRQIVCKAEASLRRTLTIARQQHAKAWELRAAIGLARLWQGQKKRQAARQLLTEVYSWFTEGFTTPDLQEAKMLLDELV